MALLRPRRGEVWWVNFDPSIGTEVKNERPAVVLSNDASNTCLDRVQVVPLTSNVERVYPSECLLSVKAQKCKAMADQLRTVSLARCRARAAALADHDLARVEAVVRLQLGLR